MLSLALLFVAGTASAFLWVANLPGVDTSILKRSPQPLVKRQANATCPFNPDHPGAAPINPLYPYTGALLDGLPGTGIGGVQVPAPGDTAHYYTPPGPNDIRGPCPGMNTAANHNVSHPPFLSPFTAWLSFEAFFRELNIANTVPSFSLMTA